MEPKFVELESFLVVGMCGWFDPRRDMARIPQLWHTFMTRREGAPPKPTYGVCFHPDPGNPEAGMFYMAATRAENLDDIPRDMVGKTIPGGRYAVFTHKGKIAQLPATLDYIWRTWLPESGCTPTGTADFELYDERWVGDTDESEFDIYVPVKD